MKLSELSRLIYDIELVIDTDFDALGMATTVYDKERVLSYISDEKFIENIKNNKNIVAVIINHELHEKMGLSKDIGIIIAENPKDTFYKIHDLLVRSDFYHNSQETIISESAQIHSSAFIATENVIIGANTIIESGVQILENTIIGKNVIVRSGTVIGSSGFQFNKKTNDVFDVKSSGQVLIYDDVEIRHNCVIDKGVFGGSTIIHNKTKIDSLVHISHDVKIGERVLITSGSTIAGRVSVGSDVWIGMNATISNGIILGDNSRISLGSVVTKDVPNGKTVSGNFAIEHSKFLDDLRRKR